VDHRKRNKQEGRENYTVRIFLIFCSIPNIMAIKLIKWNEQDM